MPTPESAAGGVYCDSSCHEIKPKYAVPKFEQKKSAAKPRDSETAVHLK
jgi:hypothetical protein